MDLHLKSIQKCNLLFVIFLFFCCHLASIQGLSSISNSKTKTFTFPNDNNSPQQQQQQQQQQPQQQQPIPAQGTTGSIPLSLSGDGQINLQTYIRLTRQLITGSLTPNISNTGTSSCECVPPGSCSNGTPGTPDGSGQIDIRIVNNPGAISTPSPLTCNYGLTLCCQAGSYQCGRRYPPPPGSSAAGAGQAEFGEYPWQAALLTTAEVYLGSGALITAQHILTVAHKVNNLAMSSFKVRVGEWDASGTSEPIPAQDVLISNVFLHPNFNQNNLQNDVAILRLATPVSLSSKSTVGTICLPSVSFAGQRCYVAGWGKNDFGPTGAYQAIQREVDVPLMSNSDCQAALQRTRLGATFALSNASFICAGGEAGKDACTGDGGSPLVCQNNGLWYVVGMVAWGIGCATAGVPGVYVNVATYLPWIQTILASG